MRAIAIYFSPFDGNYSLLMIIGGLCCFTHPRTYPNTAAHRDTGGTLQRLTHHTDCNCHNRSYCDSHAGAHSRPFRDRGAWCRTEQRLLSGQFLQTGIDRPYLVQTDNGIPFKCDLYKHTRIG